LVRGSLVVVPRLADRRGVGIRVFEWRNGRAYLLEPDGSAVEGIVFVGEVVLD
jgi:hypothetical protein